MNYLKTSPKGIDRAIEQLQKPLYKLLVAKNPNINGYGRVYKNKKNDSFILESFTGNNEYKDVLGGEGSRFFFYLHNEMNGDANLTARVDVVFMVKLTDFFSGTSERKDEEFRALVSDTIQKSRFRQQKTIIGIEHIEGIVSKRYDKVDLNYSDMHPYHVVTFQTEVNYQLKNC